MRKLWLFACVLLAFRLGAQPICGFDGVHEKLLKTDTAYRKMIRQTDNFIRDYIANNPKVPKTTGLGTALYIIPVVVHVVHTGGAIGSIYNPDDATIIATIDYLNKVYDGTASDISGGVGDIQIQFQLAKRDPNCNATNGIDRVNGSSLSGYVNGGVNRNNSGGASELSVKNLSRWNTSSYYNVWLVNKIDGNDGTSGQFIAGYAYFPGAPATLDGTVMLATQFEPNNKVLPHEIGHAFNLYHPFNGSSLNSDCPVNNDCSNDGDRICDTDPVSQNVNSSGVFDFSCRTGINVCTGTPYSPNTENNIMGYTNCSNLFTAGQKARMLASMALQSRASLANSLGATATSGGATQCAPKINFEVPTSLITEATTATAGCRGYKDYTYDMVIGNTPSAAATVTFQFSGTATQGVDYVFTTNGNFSTPSNVLTFPAGSLLNRTFSLRIFDDESVESDETIIIDFTVNNNGGNAAKGEAIPTHKVTLISNDLLPAKGYLDDIQIGNYTTNLGSSSTTSVPFDAKITSQKTTILYRADELLAAGFKAGRITQFGIFLNKNSTRSYGNLKISMGLTSRNLLVDATSAYAVNVKLVKSFSTYSTVDGLNNFVLDSVFTWDGINNVAVQFCYTNFTSSPNQKIDVANAYSDGSAATEGTIYFANISCGASYTSVNYYPNGYKPVAKFVIASPGADVETKLNATGSAYLGPFDDVYFYSADGNILARIKNLSAFDYGCTQVTVDRAGTTSKNYTAATASGAVADKTIVVVPTNNNASGNYQISLYYTQSEIAGWQNATGKQWAEAKILKTPNAVSSYTPGQVPSGFVTSAPKITSSYSTDSTVTATFSNGFSGFALGNPVLANNVYTFTGNGLWSNAANWSNGTVPPAVLPSGAQIIVDPIAGGKCTLNSLQTIQPGASLRVNSGKTFEVAGYLRIQK